MVVLLFCVALLCDQSLAVLNKKTNKNVENESSRGDEKSENNAEDRISNEYGVPRPGLNRPGPVYGPPELTGNHAPVQIFPPPPAELPPPPPPQNFGRPHSSYGPPRKIPQFGPRPIKVAPWKLAGSAPRFPGFQAPSQIPVSLESYGPPANVPPPSFSPPRPNYGAPLSLPPIPQAPPPGVPAPPTPPDIKYDGWQPIAGHVESPNINLPPPTNNFDHSANVNLPSNSYGEPINNPEDHNLKQSVGQGDQGLPPPKLPETEILHNIQEAAQSLPPHKHSGQQQLNSFESLPTATSNLASSFNVDAPSGYESARGNSQSQDLSFQLPPPGPTNIISDSYGAPPSNSFSSNGPYATSNFGGNFGFRQHQYRQQHSSSFSSFRPRGHNSYRPHGLPNSLIPPRSRAPIKFRESVPMGLINSIGSYLPPPQITPSGPIKPAATYGQPGRFNGHSFQQQLPTLQQSISFNSASSYEKSPLAAPNVNYGTPLTFTSFNTPAPVLTYGAPNFGPTGSFISSSNVAGGNLYDQQTVLSTSYGSPQVFNGQHDCTGFQQKPIEIPIQLPSLSLHSQANLDSSSSIGEYSVPSINELDLESPNTNNQQSQIKDSYGNPTGADGNGIYDQRSASSSLTNFNSQTIVNSAGTAEALTAALTAQGYGSQTTQDNYNNQHPTDSYNQGTNNVVSTTNTLNVDQLSQLHGDSEPALALAQTLSAEGASPDGFQIQGSKGTYSLQIQSANGLQHNSDGSIRHDQLLSNGLLQDILAAIEQPGSGKNHIVQIQGGPQAQQLAEIHQQAYQSHHTDDLSHAATSSLASSSNDEQGVMSPEDVALFFNNNYSEQTQKEIRSTAKSEGNVENLVKSSDNDDNEKTDEKKSS
uniref:Uncharacterized protein n=1 Tax=Bracon brevicornis TaxID=1563983 RepID=A0A6V7LDB1_9HYME